MVKFRGPCGAVPHRPNRRPQKLNDPCRLPTDPGAVQTPLPWPFSPRGLGRADVSAKMDALGVIGPSNNSCVAGRRRSSALPDNDSHRRMPSTASRRFRALGPLLPDASLRHLFRSFFWKVPLAGVRPMLSFRLCVSSPGLRVSK